MRRSLVLPAFFPASMEDADELVRAIHRASARVDAVEFFYSGAVVEAAREAIAEEMRGCIFLAAMAIKREQLNLSDLVESRRARAVERLQDYIDRASDWGAEGVLINSGFRPESEELLVDAEAALEIYIQTEEDDTCTALMRRTKS